MPVWLCGLHEFRDFQKMPSSKLSQRTHACTQKRLIEVLQCNLNMSYLLWFESLLWGIEVPCLFSPKEQSGFHCLRENNTRREEQLIEYLLSSSGWVVPCKKFDLIWSNQVRTMAERLIWNMTSWGSRVILQVLFNIQSCIKAVRLD